VLRFASLASGSQGNCLVVEAREHAAGAPTRVLLDCGLTLRETVRRLGRVGLEPGEIDALLVTHEHDDHLGSAFAFSATHGATLCLTRGTLRAAEEAGRALPEASVRLIDGRARFSLGALEIDPFTVPHDAREPVQAAFTDGRVRLGVLTDLGAPTAHVRDKLADCDALVLECNHDLDLLAAGAYPRWLKDRISGPLGHLDNGAAAALLASIGGARLQHVIAAHLSDRNNRPALARAALAGALDCAEDWIGVATQTEGFDWRTLE